MFTWDHLCIFMLYMYAHMYESLQMFTWDHLCVFMLYTYAHMCIHTAFPDAKALGWLFISFLPCYCHLKQLGDWQGLKLLSYHTHSRGPATAL